MCNFLNACNANLKNTHTLSLLRAKQLCVVTTISVSKHSKLCVVYISFWWLLSYMYVVYCCLHQFSMWTSVFVIYSHIHMACSHLLLYIQWGGLEEIVSSGSFLALYRKTFAKYQISPNKNVLFFKEATLDSYEDRFLLLEHSRKITYKDPKNMWNESSVKLKP